ncbi:hypothetical protein AC1031_008766 [Aphanomyces cochlioides]|nr:hypothetical protein AC1031_008766 [Aphanomyces cochlioides]
MASKTTPRKPNDKSNAPSSAKKAQSQRILWNTDGVAGGKSSMDVLIEWLSNETNYSRWKGSDRHSGTKKSVLASEIKRTMMENGLLHRKAKDIMQKVSVLEQQYRSARDWLNNTGQGIEDQATIDDEVKKICPYFFDLDSVMHDRASSEALATSDNLDDSDGDIEKENVIKPLDKKRSAAQAKLDEWTAMNNKSMSIKEKEIEQREREFVAKTDLDVRRLQIEEKGESRLEREGDLNLRLLQIKHEEAMLRLALQREEAQMNIRLKKM